MGTHITFSKECFRKDCFFLINGRLAGRRIIIKVKLLLCHCEPITSAGKISLWKRQKPYSLIRMKIGEYPAASN